MIRALYFDDHQDFKAKAYPGSFFLFDREFNNLFEMSYFCPCGCGIEGRLLLGKGHKPGGERPSWHWHGSVTEPTLTPSVDHRGHWHGWLRDGYWVSV